jgi:metal-dependent amidase/aminoacylase/carboxypeptidase family protein
MKPNRALGEVFTRFMEGFGMPLHPPASNAMGSTDMGDVSQVVPSIHAYLEICDEGVAGHSPEFAEASISERGQKAMLVAAKSLAATAIEVLSDPGLVARMWEEFRTT